MVLKSAYSPASVPVADGRLPEFACRREPARSREPVYAQSAMSSPTRSYKGNKQFLPSKPCLVCGREMSWRKKWERNWDEVKYCSEACRKKGASQPG